ncbi:hypothetical protein LCGC14_1104810 [marine sediment metagenome]|uniref:Uncharacterized protein n=1 Tax=marine sediment metagenome TaxID=412755 RepID=A0A0F9MWD3_9ZZZZ
MDTSETYIKMADCEEIQVLNPARMSPVAFREYQREHDTSVWRGFTWLPRLDQLQEMVLASHNWTSVDLVWHFSEWAVKATNEWGNTTPFATMEQLWLAFVMKEKYNKTWSGEEWTVIKAEVSNVR